MRKAAIRWLAVLALGLMTWLPSAMGQLPPAPGGSGPPPPGAGGGQQATPQLPVNNADRSSVLQYAIAMIGVVGIMVIVCAPSRKQVGR